DRLLATLRQAAVKGDAAHRRFQPRAKSREGLSIEPGDVNGRDWCVYPMKDRSGAVRQLILVMRDRGRRPHWLNVRGVTAHDERVTEGREPRTLLRVMPGGLNQTTGQIT